MTHPDDKKMLTLQIPGLNAFKAVVDWDILAQPEVDDALRTVETRVLRQGKGLGAERNTLSSELYPLQMRVESTTVWPRTRGTSWGRKNVGIVRSTLTRALTAAVGRMTARWAQGGR